MKAEHDPADGAKITTVLLQSKVFNRKSRLGVDALSSHTSHKTKRKLWCREGELNPQGTKYRRILSSTVRSEPL